MLYSRWEQAAHVLWHPSGSVTFPENVSFPHPDGDYVFLANTHMAPGGRLLATIRNLTHGGLAAWNPATSAWTPEFLSSHTEYHLLHTSRGAHVIAGPIGNPNSEGPLDWQWREASNGGWTVRETWTYPLTTMIPKAAGARGELVFVNGETWTVRKSATSPTLLLPAGQSPFSEAAVCRMPFAGRLPDGTPWHPLLVFCKGKWSVETRGGSMMPVSTDIPHPRAAEISETGVILPALTLEPGTADIWRDGKLHSLDKLVSSGWSDVRGNVISPNGLIAGTALRAGGQAPENVLLLPVEAVPEVLAVNSDFDEGRIDPATGYAIPDCDDMPSVDLKTGAGNTKLELDAERNHLDGTFTQGEDVIDDLHKGWFGVNPKLLDDDFWAGANVTIRKVDKIDSDTGYKESGQVRFYAKWNGGYYGISPYDFQTLQPVNLVAGGVNGNNSSVYGASSTIPDGAEFYMEGVRPGKITLEWRYQKGSIDVKHEQTFKVETRKTVAEWREEVRYQIRLQSKVKSGTEVDVALYHPGDGFRNANAAQDNVLRVVAIYDYYQQLFKQMPEKFMWAGMAKVAAAPIYAGMSDLNTWWIATGVTPPWPPYQGFGDRDTGVEIFIEGLLLSGQKAIFSDMAWAHRAYKASGIWALKHLRPDSPDATDYEAWISMDDGIQSNDNAAIFEANGNLLRREQEEVVQQSYNLVQNLQMRQPPAYPSINGGVMVAVDANGLANAGEWLSANSNNNPLPGGPGFRATFPGARLDFFNDRWAWTSNAATGMLQIWTGTSTSAPGFDAGRRASENEKTIRAAASAYSYDPAGLP